MPLRSQVEPLQDIEHFKEHHAASGGRRRCNDLVPAVRPGKRLAFNGAVVTQVLAREYATSRLHLLNDPIRYLSTIKSVCTLVDDRLQGPGQITLP